MTKKMISIILKIFQAVETVIVPAEIFVAPAYARQRTAELYHWMAAVIPVNDVHVISGVSAVSQRYCWTTESIVPRLVAFLRA